MLEAGNGKEALDRMRDASVDMVITDLVMPEHEGIETIQALRQEHPKVKIIAISGAFGGYLPENGCKVGRTGHTGETHYTGKTARDRAKCDAVLRQGKENPLVFCGQRIGEQGDPWR